MIAIYLIQHGENPCMHAAMHEVASTCMARRIYIHRYEKMMSTYTGMRK
jgi:hypothetical protein